MQRHLNQYDHQNNPNHKPLKAEEKTRRDANNSPTVSTLEQYPHQVQLEENKEENVERKKVKVKMVSKRKKNSGEAKSGHVYNTILFNKSKLHIICLDSEENSSTPRYFLDIAEFLLARDGIPGNAASWKDSKIVNKKIPPEDFVLIIWDKKTIKKARSNQKSYHMIINKNNLYCLNREEDDYSISSKLIEALESTDFNYPAQVEVKTENEKPTKKAKITNQPSSFYYFSPSSSSSSFSSDSKPKVVAKDIKEEPVYNKAAEEVKVDAVEADASLSQPQVCEGTGSNQTHLTNLPLFLFFQWLNSDNDHPSTTLTESLNLTSSSSSEQPDASTSFVKG